MATVSEILDALEARYDIIIEKNSIDDLKKAIERSRAEKAIDKKSKIATARGTTGAGGGGITQSQVKGAIESATNLDAIESSLVSIGSGQITQAEVKAAIESATNLDGVETSLASILSGLLTQADIKAAIESATNIDGVESALADVITAIEGISVGGGGATQAEVKAAIESATNLDGVETSLASILSGLLTQADIKAAIESATNLDAIESSLVSIGSGQITQADVKAAIESATNLDGVETSLASIVSGQITQAEVKAAIESATNLDGVETALADVITAIEGISVGGGAGATQAEIKTAIESASNLDGIETSLTTISNKSFATDTLQAAGNATLLEIDTNASDLNTAIGDQADLSATSDTGTFSLIALAKRLLSKFQLAPQLPDNALSIALPTKLTVTGITSTAVINTNLLDSAGTGLAIDVRDFNSGELTVISTATTGSYIVQAAIDSAFTIGVTTLQLFESTVLNANPINGAITPTNSTRKFLVNLQGANYLRVSLTTATAGVRPILVLSQLGHIPNQFNVTQATNASLQTNTTISPNQAVIASTQPTVNSVVGDVASSVLSTSTTTAAIAPTWGVAYRAVIAVTVFTATSLSIALQESADAGVTWYTVYKLPLITAVGVYKTPMLPVTGNRLRYVQTLVGGSVTRAITRLQSNNSIPTIDNLVRSGGISTIVDLPISGRARRVVVNNRSASTIFLQVHDKVTALSTGDIPSAEIYPVVANGVVVLSTADLSQYGTKLGDNPRLGLSSTFDTYTPISPANTSIFVETL